MTEYFLYVWTGGIALSILFFFLVGVPYTMATKDRDLEDTIGLVCLGFVALPFTIFFVALYGVQVAIAKIISNYK